MKQEIKKIDGKIYCCWNDGYADYKAVIYKANSEKPYFRFLGRYYTLKDELLDELRKIAGEPKKKKPEDDIRKGYRAEIIKIYGDDSSLVEYCMKKAGAILKLDNGNYIEFETPSIKTRFCFGWHTHDDEGYKDANRMARYAEESHEYFKSENLKELDKQIAQFENGDKMYYYRNYRDYDVSICEVGTSSHWLWNEQAKEITANDYQRILAALKDEKIRFEKRLDTYLKKYGTSKIKSWSYWADE